jgi:hypothetical protein
MSDFAPISTEVMQRQKDYAPISTEIMTRQKELLPEDPGQSLLDIVRKKRSQQAIAQGRDQSLQPSPLEPGVGGFDMGSGLPKNIPYEPRTAATVPQTKVEAAQEIPETSQPVPPEYSPTENVPPYEAETTAVPPVVSNIPTPPIISKPLGPMGAVGGETSPIIPVKRAAAAQAGPTPAEAGAAVARGELSGAIPKELSFAEKLWKVAPILARGIGEMIQGYHAGLARSSQPPQYMVRQSQEFEAGQQERQFQRQLNLSEIENRYAQGLLEIKNKYEQDRYLAEQKYQKSRDEVQFGTDMQKARYEASVQHELLDKRVKGDIAAAEAGVGRTVGLKGLNLGDIAGNVVAGTKQ